MAEEIITSPEESVSMEAPIVEAPVNIQEEVVDVEPTPPANNDGADNLKKLHKILAADELYGRIVPTDFNEFLSKYSDVSKIQKLHKILAADELYGRIMPSDINEAAEKYGFGGLGKPSAVPSASVGGGSATKGRGVEQPSMSLPTYLSPEELEAGARAEAKLPSEGVSNVERRQQIDENEKLVKRAKYEDQFQAIEQASRDAADQETGLEQNPAERLKNSLARGSATLLSSLYRSPAFVLDMLYVPQNYIADKYDIPSLKATGKEALGFLYDEKNPFSLESSAQELDKYVERSQKRFQAKYSESLTSAISNGNYADAIGILSNQIAESAPVTISLMMGNAAGLSATGSTLAGGVVFGAGKKQELDKNNPEMSETQKATTAFLSGITEGFFEQYGISKLGGITKRILEKSGADVARKFAEEGFKKMYGKAFVRYLGVSSEEALGETATQFAQNVIDKYSGAKPDLDLRDGLADSFVGGFGQSSVYSAIPGAITVAKTIRGKKKQQEIQQKRDELSAIALSEDIPDASKRALGDKIKDLNEEEANVVNADKELYNSLSEEGKSKLTTLTNDAEQIEVTLQNPNIPDEARAILDEKLKSINGELESIQKTFEEAPSLPSIQLQAPEINLATPKNPFDASLEKLGYSEGDIQGMTTEQKQEIAINKTQAPVVESSAKVDSVKENKRQEKIAEAQAKLDEEQAPQTLPEVENAIANLREQEQAENEAIDPNDEAAKEEIYDKYDEAITPLLEQEEELKAEAPVAEEAKGEVEQTPTALSDVESFVNNFEFKGNREYPTIAKVKKLVFKLNTAKERLNGLNKSPEETLGLSNNSKEFNYALKKTKEATELEIKETQYKIDKFKREITREAEQNGLSKDDVLKAVESLLSKEQTSKQAPESFPAQEGAESVQDKFQANSELEQIYRDLNAAVNKNIDPNTLEAVKRNPTLVMVEKALRELERKGIIKIDC
jgi:hypothetical protein